MKKTWDGAWLDSMYNNRELVPDFADYLRRWAARSADAMRTPPRELDVRYGGGPSEHLDVFRCEQDNAPVMVFIHGGYWRALDKRDHAFIAPAFTKEGVCVVIPNYALCPAVTVPQIVMQQVLALAWTYRQIARHGGDPNRITVVGHSAGGHLAAMMFSSLWPVFARDLPADLVKGAMSISGLHDLEPILHAPFLQPSLHLTRDQVKKASPALFAAPPQGSLYAVCGGDESEEFHRQNGLLQAAWGTQRVPVSETIPGCNHFSVLEALVEPGSRLNTLALELVKRS
ncbi:MAG: alpha/beta hydrolase [Pseudomonadota bacterium]